ncbi:hypothetical protein BGZ95_005412 [Linnemannia exigua]|uniref:Uncharacterized protein n=1 Tax=Linnemannia exigua TaxID=604196 RepID=A0AAD4HC18_9FUNG|nr:hypothetical protein BGZ95_005412 [Linnemannia exigua]
MQRASALFFQTPELRARLAIHLSKKAIARLAKTCHRLRNSFVPLLWKDLEFTSERKVDACLEELMNLGRRAKFVSTLMISKSYLTLYVNGLKDSPSFLLERPPWLPVPHPDYCLPGKFYPMNRLTRLDCSLAYGRQEVYIARCAQVEVQYSTQELAQVCWLMELNPGLTHVSLRSVSFRSSLDIRSLSRAIKSLNHLVALHIDCIPSRETWASVYWTIFLSCSPTLESFDIKPGRMSQDFMPELTPQSDDPDAMLGPLRLYSEVDPRRNLRLLVLSMSKKADILLYCHILRMCPRLQRLDLEVIGSRSNEIKTIAPWIQQYCPEVSTVRVGQAQRFLVEDNIMDLLAGLNTSRDTLHTLYYEKFSESDPRNTLKMIHQHHRTLRDIRLIDTESFRSIGIRTLLTTCYGLERLEIVNEEGPAGDAMVEDLVAQPWVCQGLRHLQMGVVWGEFENKTPFYLQDPETVQTPRDFERWVLLEKFYFQVGSMTRLEVLGLKAYLAVDIDDISEGELYDGIEDDMRDKAAFPQLMTLLNEKTGRVGYLNYLCRLKNLRELRGSVHLVSEEIQATFGQREVEWVVHHWPRLKVIELIPYQPAKPKRIKGNAHLNYLMKYLPGIDIRRPAVAQEDKRDHIDDLDDWF